MIRELSPYMVDQQCHPGVYITQLGNLFQEAEKMFCGENNERDQLVETILIECTPTSETSRYEELIQSDSSAIKTA